MIRSFSNPQGLAHFVTGKSNALALDIPMIAIKRNDDLGILEYFLTIQGNRKKSGASTSQRIGI